MAFLSSLIVVSASASAAFASGLAAETSIGQDEMAVYETVLASWLEGGSDKQLVNEKLSAPPLASDPNLKECTDGLHFSQNASSALTQKTLAGVQFKRNGIQLIDGSRWNPNDPQQAISKGESVDTAVKEGFSHSLISFSQITFSDDRRDALVGFGMVCGSLCGSGATMHLHSDGTRWEVVNRCRNWIS